MGTVSSTTTTSTWALVFVASSSVSSLAVAPAATSRAQQSSTRQARRTNATTIVASSVRVAHGVMGVILSLIGSYSPLEVLSSADKLTRVKLYARRAYAILWGCNASIGDGSCAPQGKAVMTVYGNQIYRESGRTCPFSSGCDIACGMDSDNASMLSMMDFQAKCGLGGGAAVHPVPNSTEIAAWSRELLSIPASLPSVLSRGSE